MATGQYPHVNPTERWCWKFCNSCNRCEDKGRYSQCGGCSGRYDPKLAIPADDDDFCDCKNGVLRWRTQQGRIVITRFKSNPYAGKVTYEKKSEDERDWDSYVNDMREKLNDPNWNPIHIYDED
jgi:hypothetical protein